MTAASGIETPCVICMTPIHMLASKCTHCGSWQDWRGRLDISAAMVSLLIALISVSGTSALLLRGAFTPKRAVIHAAFQTARESGVAVFVGNDGARAGSVAAYVLVIRDGGGQIVDQASLDPVGDDMMAVMIAPGAAQLLRFAGEHFHRRHRIRSDRSLTCEGVIVGTDFDGRRLFSRHPIECRALAPYARLLDGRDAPGWRVRLSDRR